MKKKILACTVVVFGCVLAVAYWMLKAPKVSIVMPVYNGAKYLDQTIGFLLASDFTDFEFVIIDDGSTDNSWEKLQEFAAQDSRVKLYKNDKNMGIVKTRNRGWQLARGEYIAPMDQDDWSLPNRLSLEVEYLDKHPDVAIVDVGTISMADYYKGVKTTRVGAISYLFKDDEAEIQSLTLDERDENIKLSLFFSCGLPVQSAAMMRRSWFDENNLHWKEGIKYGDDYQLYADMIKKGAHFHHIADIAHVYNDVREHSTTFVQQQIKEVDAAKRGLFKWVGLSFDDYLNMDVEEFMCKLFEDLLKVAPEKSRFSVDLLKKNQRLLCQTKA